MLSLSLLCSKADLNSTGVTYATMLDIGNLMQRAKILKRQKSKGMYSNGAAESSLDGEKIIQNAGNITMQKSRNFKLHVQCLTKVGGGNPFELMIHLDLLVTKIRILINLLPLSSRQAFSLFSFIFNYFHGFLDFQQA